MSEKLHGFAYNFEVVGDNEECFIIIYHQIIIPSSLSGRLEASTCSYSPSPQSFPLPVKTILGSSRRHSHWKNSL